MFSSFQEQNPLLLFLPGYNVKTLFSLFFSTIISLMTSSTSLCLISRICFESLTRFSWMTPLRSPLLQRDCDATMTSIVFVTLSFVALVMMSCFECSSLIALHGEMPMMKLTIRWHKLKELDHVIDTMSIFQRLSRSSLLQLHCNKSMTYVLAKMMS